jgi:hypothetical protein
MSFSLNATFTNLSTVTTSLPSAGQYLVAGKLQLPTIDQGSASQSQVVVTITQTPSGGGPTTIYTGSAGARGFAVNVTAATLDSIAVALSSSAAVDQLANAIQCTLSIAG